MEIALSSPEPIFSDVPCHKSVQLLNANSSNSQKWRRQNPDTCSSVRIYNGKTNFISTNSTDRSSSTTAIKGKQQACDGQNIVLAQMQISVDFKTIDPKITE